MIRKMWAGDIYHFEDEPYWDEPIRNKAKLVNSAEHLQYALYTARRFFALNSSFGPREMCRGDLYDGAAF